MKHLPLFLLLTLATAVAEVPSLINYQGRLVTADGAAQSGQKSFLLEVFEFVFRLLNTLLQLCDIR